MNTRIMTVDLEPDLRSRTCKSMELIPDILEIFDQYNIKGTFFTVTNLLERHEFEIKEIAKKHEIASHSHTHNWLTKNNSEWEMKKSLETLREYKIRCKGFRAPGFITTKNHFELLKKYGYDYDASMARFFPGRYSRLTMPSKPFVRRGIVEFPMPTFVPPSINAGLSYLKLFHPVSKVFPKPYMFYLHPWEFLEKKELINGRSLVGNLLQRNAGKKAIKIFKNYLDRCDGNWISCEEWMENNKNFLNK
ncbi:MAG: polysaccharide deacetylase family protein [archaeon]|nr:polysaccharide deacetylase family protein [archaeon]